MSRSTLLAVMIGTIILAGWEYAARHSIFFPLLVSSPLRLWGYLQVNARFLAIDMLHTLAVASAGLIVAMVVGISLGLLGLRSARSGRILEGFGTIAQSIPLLVFAPFAVILFGVGYTSQITLASIMATFPCMIGVISAARIARGEFEELLDFHNVPFTRRVTEVYFPYVLPSLMATFRVAASLALLGAVLAEFTGSAVGLGRNIFLGTVRLEPELMVISLLLTSILGVTVHLAISGLEKRASWWR